MSSSSPQLDSKPFDELQADLQAEGADAVLERLAGLFREQRRYHELFDTRLMQSRHRLGLPVILATSLEDLPEPERTAVEEAYLTACREVGWLLWDDGKFREAWLYLRPLGENATVAAALGKVEPDEANVGELIQLALHEGVAPTRGLEWILQHYGTCNAVTAFDSEMGRFRRTQQQDGAALMIRHVHAELLTNVRSDVARRKPDDGSVAAPTLTALVAGHPEIFDENNYHVDTSHLSATVRFARIVEDPDVLELAWELTEYGRRLGATFQFAGDEPFVDVYPSHGLFFAAQLGRQIDEAIAYFRQKAEEAPAEEVGTAAAETYLVLLTRLKRYDEAFAAYKKLIPAGVRTSGFAPTMLELARLAGDFDGLMQFCRERDDLLGFAAGLLSAIKG